MARFIFQFLATVALVAGSTSAQLDFGKLKEYATDFKEQFSNNATDPPAGKRPLHGLLSGLEFGGTGNNAYDGRDGDPQTLTLGPGEYITSIEAHTGEKDGRKRISFIKFTTNKNNYVSGGTLTDDIGKEDAPEEGYQIGGFFGKRGDEIDSVAAIWATILP
ncbi:hypothetical protein PI124_g5080 [Phytophthora idaei]|nr:hypothetical protein PI124_g5080 [Phytophthora idaei]